MRKVLRRGVAGVLLGATLLGTTAFAGTERGVGSFSFQVAPGDSEEGAGAWINKSRGQNYADVYVKSFSGVGAYVYVKNTKFAVVSNQVNVTGTGHKYPAYSSAFTNNNYQLFASPSYSGPYRITVLKGEWQP